MEAYAGLIVPRRIAAAALVLLALAAYAPVISGGFIWDDDAYVTENATLRSVDGLRRIWFEPIASPQYYPLVFTTFWAEYRMWGLSPAGYHLTNVLLHGFNGVLLWFGLRALRAPAPWLIAAVFVLHPVHAESVAWVTERKNVLSGLFYLAAALAYFRFSPPEAGDTRHPHRWGWYFVALGLFVCALLSKTVTATLPAALLLMLWWRRGSVRWRDVVPLAPFFLAGVVLGLYTVWLEKHHVGATGQDWTLSPVDRCLVAGRALWFYAGKLGWPADLSFIYPRWSVDAGAAWQYVYPVAVVVVLVGLWVARRRVGLGPLVACLFFAGTLFPALGFFDVYPMRFSFVADHFQYLASAGLLACLVAAGQAAMRRLLRPGSWMPMAAGLALLLVLGFLTADRART
jgi:hypothetical protein